MKKTNTPIKLSCVLFCFMLMVVSCKPDTPQSDRETSADTLAEDIIGANVDTTQQDKSLIKNMEVSTKPIEALPPQTAKAVEASINKGKDCDAILKAYEALIQKIAKEPTPALGQELSQWTNDPLYNECYNNDKVFRAKIDQLDEMLE